MGVNFAVRGVEPARLSLGARNEKRLVFGKGDQRGLLNTTARIF